MPSAWRAIARIHVRHPLLHSIIALWLVHSCNSIVDVPSPVPSPQSNQTNTTAVPFNITTLENASFRVLTNSFPTYLCPSSNVTYTRIFNLSTGSFLLPHSRIFHDGQRCGPLLDNATDTQLRIDSAMELVPLSYLLTEDLAERHGALAIYNRLWTQRPFSRSFFNFSRKQLEKQDQHSSIYVGLERFGPRICNKNAILPFNTFVFIGAFDTFNLNIAPFFPHSSRLIIPIAQPFHLSFAPAPPLDNPTEHDSYPEHVCPYLRYLPPIPYTPIIRLCFPAAARVLFRNASVRMHHLRLGDHILDPTGTFTPVILFSHAHRTSTHEFLRLSFKNISTTLTLSPAHLIVTPSGLAPATTLRCGDVIRLTSGVAQISSLSRVRRSGLYNPHTLSGWLVVDGVAVSCYTTAVPPFAAHALLAPVRALYRTGGVPAVRPISRLVISLAHWLEDNPVEFKDIVQASVMLISKRAMRFTSNLATRSHHGEHFFHS